MTIKTLIEQLQKLDPELEIHPRCGSCKEADESVTACYDPYAEDVNDTKMPVFLCRSCYQESCDDI